MSIVLVTGATGFLGHHLIPMLVEAGYTVRAVVRPTSNVEFLQKHGVQLAYAQDITDEKAIQTACQGCDYVIHAAGQFRFWGDEGGFHQTNVVGTRIVLDAAVSAQVKRLIHISTIAVAGKIEPGQLIDENFPCLPQEPYQMTKYQGEQLALSYAHEGKLPVVVIRPGAFYGPWGRYAFNRLFFEEPLRGWRIKVSRGIHINFPVYTADVARGILLALQKGRPGEVYNICGQSLSHNEGNDVVSDLAGISRWRMNIPKFAVLILAQVWTWISAFTKREPFYPINLRLYVFQDWQVSIEKARRELGFEPTPFKEGAKATLDWYEEQGILRWRAKKR